MFHSDPSVETKQHQSAQPPIKILVSLHIYIYMFVCVCVRAHMHADVMCVECIVYCIYVCTHVHARACERAHTMKFQCNKIVRVLKLYE